MSFSQPTDRQNFVTQLRHELARERLLFGTIAGYLAFAEILNITLGTVGPIWFLAPVVQQIVWVVIAGIVCVLTSGVWVAALSRAEGSPIRHAVAELRRLIQPRHLASFILLCAIVCFLTTFGLVKAMLPKLAAFRHDRWLADLDFRLHGGIDPWRLLQPLLGHYPVTRVIETAYFTVWLALLLVFCALLAMRPSLAPLRRQFFVTFILCWIVLGNLLAGLFMSGGPVYFGKLTGDVTRFAELNDYLSFGAGLLNSAHSVQLMLWENYVSGHAGVGTGISAFPSLHLSMATLFALTAWRIDRRLGWIMSAYGAVIMAGSVHLGWHYAIDGYFSVPATIGLWFIAGVASRRRTAIAGLASAARPTAEPKTTPVTA